MDETQFDEFFLEFEDMIFYLSKKQKIKVLFKLLCSYEGHMTPTDIDKMEKIIAECEIY